MNIDGFFARGIHIQQAVSNKFLVLMHSSGDKHLVSTRYDRFWDFIKITSSILALDGAATSFGTSISRETNKSVFIL